MKYHSWERSRIMSRELSSDFGLELSARFQDALNWQLFEGRLRALNIFVSYCPVCKATKKCQTVKIQI